MTLQHLDTKALLVAPHTCVHAALVQAACYVDATHAVPAGRINRCRTAPRKPRSGTPMTQTGTASGAQRNLSRQVGP
uniref:Uncharacterized protein n=1 Tax=Anopheles arabiensis TaxID=7173 RepID=A0A182IAD4_ANOAR